MVAVAYIHMRKRFRSVSVYIIYTNTRRHMLFEGCLRHTLYATRPELGFKYIYCIYIINNIYMTEMYTNTKY